MLGQGLHPFFIYINCCHHVSLHLHISQYHAHALLCLLHPATALASSYTLCVTTARRLCQVLDPSSVLLDLTGLLPDDAGQVTTFSSSLAFPLSSLYMCRNVVRLTAPLCVQVQLCASKRYVAIQHHSRQHALQIQRQRGTTPPSAECAQGAADRYSPSSGNRTMWLR